MSGEVNKDRLKMVYVALKEPFIFLTPHTFRHFGHRKKRFTCENNFRRIIPKPTAVVFTLVSLRALVSFAYFCGPFYF